MMHQSETRTNGHGSLTSYIIGFILSILFTVAAYAAVVYHLFDNHAVVVSFIVGLAILQLLVQLIFFLHLTSSSGPNWNLQSFIFTVIIVGILVGGNIWIMISLGYNMTM